MIELAASFYWYMDGCHFSRGLHCILLLYLALWSKFWPCTKWRGICCSHFCLSVCLYVCLHVCNMITFESLDLEISFLVCKYIFRDTGHVRIWRLSSQCQDYRSKNVWTMILQPPGLCESLSLTATAVMASPFESFWIWCCLPVFHKAQPRSGQWHSILLIPSQLPRCADFTFSDPVNVLEILTVLHTAFSPTLA